MRTDSARIRLLLPARFKVELAPGDEMILYREQLAALSGFDPGILLRPSIVRDAQAGLRAETGDRLRCPLAHTMETQLRRRELGTTSISRLLLSPARRSFKA